MRIALRTGIPLRGPDTLYTTSGAVYYPYDTLDRGAFGEAGMYAPQFGLVSADTCINPGTLQVPPPVILSPSQVSSISDGGSDQGASQELVRLLVSRTLDAGALTIKIEAHSSFLRSAPLSSPSKEVSSARKNTRRSSDSAVCEPATGRDNRGHKRKLTWTPSMANDAPNVSQAQKDRELEELKRLEAGGAEMKGERRRLQNRMAQRAYRARSKIQKYTVSPCLG